MEAMFPIWGRSTRNVIMDFIDAGFKAVVTCVDTAQLDGSFAGREIDARFLADLPGNVDPCGEKGEFHTFVFNGPMFSVPVQFTKGDTVLRDNRFMYTDLVEIREHG